MWTPLRRLLRQAMYCNIFQRVFGCCTPQTLVEICISNEKKRKARNSQQNLAKWLFSPIKNNSNTIKLTVHTSCYWGSVLAGLNMGLGMLFKCKLECTHCWCETCSNFYIHNLFNFFFIFSFIKVCNLREINLYYYYYLNGKGWVLKFFPIMLPYFWMTP